MVRASGSKLSTLADAVAVHRDVALGLDRSSVLSFGVPWLDGAVGGVAPGSLVVVGGRTGVGKSYFSLLLLGCSREPALYVSLEDGVPEVGRRCAGMNPKRREQVLLFHPHNPRLSAVLTAIRTAVEESDARVVVVDYLQLLRYDGVVNAWSQTDQIHNTLIELKSAARELGFALILNVQIRRPMQFGGELQAPTLHELKDSASIENSAELVVLLHEDEHGLVSARVAKSKSSKRQGRALYARDESTGWLVETDEPDLYDGEAA